MSPSPPLSVHLILLAAQICFASLAVVGRMALAHLPANAIVFTRLCGGFVVFFLVARAMGPVRIPRRDWLPLVGCALLGVVLNQMLFVNGLAYSTATNATVLGSTIPVFTALFALLLGRERFRGLRFAGIATALAGALVLVGVENLSTDRDHLVGNVMILVNAASYGLFLVVVRPLSQRYTPMLLVAMLFLCGIPMVAPFGVTAWAAMPPLGATEVAFLAFIVAVPTVGAYALTQMALARAESSLVASYIYLQPVFATVGAMFVLDEQPGVRTGIAALLIFAGIFMSTRAAR